MVNFKFGIWIPSKGKNKMSNLKHCKGAWDANWECNLASTAIMWMECSFMLHSNRAKKKHKMMLLFVQIGKYEKKLAQ